MGIGSAVKRDVRIIEAPADTFAAGKAYWIGQVNNILNKEKFDKYFGSFVATNEKGFTVAMDDGTTQNIHPVVKVVTNSNFYEEAKNLVAATGKGVELVPGLSTDQGLVVILEFDNHKVGSNFKECDDYKNCLLSSLGQTLTTAEAYEAGEKEFMETVMERDVRILGIPEASG